MTQIKIHAMQCIILIWKKKTKMGKTNGIPILKVP